MKDITIPIKLERYLREWLTFHLGSPVRFPAKSYENEVLRHYLTKRPKDIEVEDETADSVRVVIPDCGHRRPEYYNYLGRSGRRALASAIESLFRLDMWSGCAHLIHSSRSLNAGIDSWCAENGISLDSREAVRQKFYRLRRLYSRYGVILGTFYTKKTATLGANSVQQ